MHGFTQREIAIVIGRSPSTICRELARNHNGWHGPSSPLRLTHGAGSSRSTGTAAAPETPTARPPHEPADPSRGGWPTPGSGRWWSTFSARTGHPSRSRRCCRACSPTSRTCGSATRRSSKPCSSRPADSCAEGSPPTYAAGAAPDSHTGAARPADYDRSWHPSRSRLAQPRSPAGPCPGTGRATY
jgi:hypothetical protein